MTNDLIIDKPEKVKLHQKFTALGITLFFWFCLVWLWQPLISLLAWAFNIKLFYDHMIVLGGYRSVLVVAFFYTVTIVTLGGGLILWGRINQHRFRGKSKRSGGKPLTIENLSEHYEVSSEDIKKWREVKQMVVETNDRGFVSNIIPGTLLAYQQSKENKVKVSLP